MHRSYVNEPIVDIGGLRVPGLAVYVGQRRLLALPEISAGFLMTRLPKNRRNDDILVVMARRLYAIICPDAVWESLRHKAQELPALPKVELETATSDAFAKWVFELSMDKIQATEPQRSYENNLFASISFLCQLRSEGIDAVALVDPVLAQVAAALKRQSTYDGVLPSEIYSPFQDGEPDIPSLDVVAQSLGSDPHELQPDLVVVLHPDSHPERTREVAEMAGRGIPVTIREAPGHESRSRPWPYGEFETDVNQSRNPDTGAAIDPAVVRLIVDRLVSMDVAAKVRAIPSQSL